MPRRYRLGLRANAKADTRKRIVDAALAILRDRGLSAVSNLAVARMADVAPATVRNHFPTRDDLLQAMFEEMLAELRVPTPVIFDGMRSRSDRVRRLATTLAAFYERSEPWWRAYEREPELVKAWGGGVDRYYASVEELMRTALGELGDDDRAVAVVAAVIGPPAYFALRSRGLETDEAVDLTLELVLPWLERRRSTKPTG